MIRFCKLYFVIIVTYNGNGEDACLSDLAITFERR